MDSIQSIVRHTAASGYNIPDFWMYAAIAEFAIILILGTALFHKRKQAARNSTKEKIMHEGDIDFNNVINSSFKSKTLFDSLKKECHPDRFTDKELNDKATEIFGLLVANKRNYTALLALKERAEKELNITFKNE